MLFRVLAKGYTETGLVREHYTFDLLCGVEHAERVARCYLTHLQAKGGMWTVKITNMETGENPMRESNYVAPLRNLANSAANYINVNWPRYNTSTMTGTWTTTTRNSIWAS